MFRCIHGHNNNNTNYWYCIFFTLCTAVFHCCSENACWCIFTNGNIYGFAWNWDRTVPSHQPWLICHVCGFSDAPVHQSWGWLCIIRKPVCPAASHKPWRKEEIIRARRSETCKYYFPSGCKNNNTPHTHSPPTNPTRAHLHNTLSTTKRLHLTSTAAGRTSPVAAGSSRIAQSFPRQASAP